ncbi:calmodulin-binding protein 25-like [Chenopodium quinoa]|uniref:VQ domain-containing protein n=1 Tax=Chenopodium quinoa TaxID=63459 RepID=A0A803LT86_CHEQI|nr:calmodulin-binding protein 25-like [Chenopodium quinoa]
MAASDNMIAAARDESWAFRTSFDSGWISEAFARDAEVLTKAFHKSICNNNINTNSYCDNGGADDVSFADLLKSETPSSHQQTQTQTQSVSSSGGGSEPETVSKRSTFRNAAAPTGKITKRKSRASKRSPTTFITADPENFRQMVQQVTGVRFPTGSAVLKPEPQRLVGVVNRLQTGCLLPTLDTSAFLLDHQQQVGGPTSMEFGPPAVVGQAGGPGFDFDGFSGFPTLESQAWIN